MQLFLCNHIYATFLRKGIYFELLSLRPCGLFFLSVFLYARLLLMDNNFLCVDEHCPVKDLTFVVRLSSYQKVSLRGILILQLQDKWIISTAINLKGQQ